jgi:hypothetical protein
VPRWDPEKHMGPLVDDHFQIFFNYSTKTQLELEGADCLDISCQDAWRFLIQRCGPACNQIGLRGHWRKLNHPAVVFII